LFISARTHALVPRRSQIFSTLLFAWGICCLPYSLVSKGGGAHFLGEPMLLPSQAPPSLFSPCDVGRLPFSTRTESSSFLLARLSSKVRGFLAPSPCDPPSMPGPAFSFCPPRGWCSSFSFHSRMPTSLHYYPFFHLSEITAIVYWFS